MASRRISNIHIAALSLLLLICSKVIANPEQETKLLDGFIGPVQLVINSGIELSHEERGEFKAELVEQLRERTTNNRGRIFKLHLVIDTVSYDVDTTDTYLDLYNPEGNSLDHSTVTKALRVTYTLDEIRPNREQLHEGQFPLYHSITNAVFIDDNYGLLDDMADYLDLSIRRDRGEDVAQRIADLESDMQKTHTDYLASVGSELFAVTTDVLEIGFEVAFGVGEVAADMGNAIVENPDVVYAAVNAASQQTGSSGSYIDIHNQNMRDIRNTANAQMAEQERQRAQQQQQAEANRIAQNQSQCAAQGGTYIVGTNTCQIRRQQSSSHRSSTAEYTPTQTVGSTDSPEERNTCTPRNEQGVPIPTGDIPDRYKTENNCWDFSSIDYVVVNKEYINSKGLFNYESGSLEGAIRNAEDHLGYRAKDECKAAGYDNYFSSSFEPYELSAVNVGECDSRNLMGTEFHYCFATGSFRCGKRQ